MMMYNWGIQISILTILMTFLNMEMTIAQSAEQEIRRIRKLSNDARKVNDVESINKFYTEDLIIVKGDGGELIGRETVNEYMVKLKTQSPDLYFERTPNNIIIAGSNKMAWEEGIWRGYNTAGQLPGYGGRYSMMWINTDAGWKMRSQQFVNLK